MLELYVYPMSKNADYLGTLEAVILIQHRCKATHKETVFVEERTLEGEIIWRGEVECFDLTGREEARTCYAWQHIDGWGHAKIFAVLGNKFIDSPERAVQAAVFTGAQPPLHRFSKELELLRQQLRECRQLLCHLGMKAEDLTAAIHTGQGIHEAVIQRQNQAA